MKRKKVKSSNIKAIGYDEETKTLEVEFHNGGIYQYNPIDKVGYKLLMKAKSIGAFFHHNIRHKKGIECNRVE